MKNSNAFILDNFAFYPHTVRVSCVSYNNCGDRGIFCVVRARFSYISCFEVGFQAVSRRPLKREDPGSIPSLPMCIL